MAETATLSSSYRICIPKALRTAKRWEAGQQFALIPKGRGVLLMPVPELADLLGIAKGGAGMQIRDRQDRV